MDIQSIGHLFWQQVAETDLLQWVAVGLGVAEVLFARANKIWLYPTGIAGTLLSIYILWVAGLFAESLLNGYYVVMSIYGWWYWVKKKHLPPVKITLSDRGDWMRTLGIVGVSFLLLAVLLARDTPLSVAYWYGWFVA